MIDDPKVIAVQSRLPFFQISRWAVVNHGQALKTDQVLARKQFPQNVIVCLILPRSCNCLHWQNQPFLHNFSSFVCSGAKPPWVSWEGHFFKGPQGRMYKLPNLSQLFRILQNISKYRTVLEHLLREEWDLMDWTMEYWDIFVKVLHPLCPQEAYPVWLWLLKTMLTWTDEIWWLGIRYSNTL